MNKLLNINMYIIRQSTYYLISNICMQLCSIDVGKSVCNSRTALPYSTLTICTDLLDNLNLFLLIHCMFELVYKIYIPRLHWTYILNIFLAPICIDLSGMFKACLFRSTYIFMNLRIQKDSPMPSLGSCILFCAHYTTEFWHSSQ